MPAPRCPAHNCALVCVRCLQMGQTFMWELLWELDHSVQASQRGGWVGGWVVVGEGGWGGVGISCTRAREECKTQRVRWPLFIIPAPLRVAMIWRATPRPRQGLPAGSRVTLLNSHPWTPEHLGEGSAAGPARPASSTAAGQPYLTGYILLGQRI